MCSRRCRFYWSKEQNTTSVHGKTHCTGSRNEKCQTYSCSLWAESHRIFSYGSEDQISHYFFWKNGQKSSALCDTLYAYVSLRGATLKRLTVKKGVECMACLSCVVACSQAFYKEFHQDKSCIQIVENNGTVKPMVCIQCGKCARECPQGAITQNANGVYMINKKLCIGCGRCKEVCPMGVCLKPANWLSNL